MEETRHNNIYEAVGHLTGTIEGMSVKVDNMAAQLDELRQEVAKAKGVLSLAKWLAPVIGGSSGFAAAWFRDWLNK